MLLKNTISSCAECDCAWKSFKHLTKDDFRLVNENRYETTFKPGEIIIKQGSPVANALFLAAGMAKIYMEGQGGKNLILNIAKPGRMIMGPGAFVDSRNNYSVAAITSVNACFISFSVFRQLLMNNGPFAMSMIEDLSTKSMEIYSRMASLASKKMPGRLAEALVYFADDIFMTDDFEMILSRQELGEMSNMAKESVVRILKEFGDSGIIKYTSSRIKILNKTKLKMIAQMG